MTSSTFVYEDLVSHVENIRDSTNDMKEMLDHRTQIGLKSRSLIFVDPYGNQTISKHMDHELIIDIFKIYKEDYVPKYLQSWIRNWYDEQ